MNTKNQYLKPILYLLFFAGITASILVYFITPRGPGVSPDSTVYIETAKNLFNGNGFYETADKPMTHFAPFYPVLLAIVAFFETDMLQASRLLNAFFFGANVILAGTVVYICTKKDLKAAGYGILVFLSSASIISAHSMAWSEPPFITFLLSGLILLSLYIANQHLYLLLTSSLAFGFAAATRYAGIAVIPTILIGLFFLGSRSTRDRIKDVLIAVPVACIPLIIWLLRNIITTQAATNRNFAIHPAVLAPLKTLILTTYDFLFPLYLPSWAKGLVFALLLMLFITAFAKTYGKHHKEGNANDFEIVFPALIIIFSSIYIFAIFISISFFDAHIGLDTRILLPILILATLTAVSLIWSFFQKLKNSAIRLACIFFLLLYIIINLNHAIPEALDIYRNGRGYNSRLWENSPAIELIKSLNKDVKIYSNGPDAIQFKTGKEALMIPEHINPFNRRINTDFGKQLQAMRRECEENKAVVVFLNNINWRWYLPAQKELEKDCKLPVLKRVYDGTIFGR